MKIFSSGSMHLTRNKPIVDAVWRRVYVKVRCPSVCLSVLYIEAAFYPCLPSAPEHSSSFAAARAPAPDIDQYLQAPELQLCVASC